MMSNTLNSKTQSKDAPIVMSQTETDALLKKVSKQLANNTFDSSDRQTLKSLTAIQTVIRLAISQIEKKLKGNNWE